MPIKLIKNKARPTGDGYSTALIVCYKCGDMGLSENRVITSKSIDYIYIYIIFPIKSNGANLGGIHHFQTDPYANQVMVSGFYQIRRWMKELTFWFEMKAMTQKAFKFQVHQFNDPLNENMNQNDKPTVLDCK